MTQKLPQIYTANHATFPIHIRKITVQIRGNFWVNQYGILENVAHAGRKMRLFGEQKIRFVKALDQMPLADQITEIGEETFFL